MHPTTAVLKQSQSTPVPAKITNAQIEQLIAMRETQRGLKDRLKLMDEAVEKLESELIPAVAGGADLSACGYDVSVQESERRYPAWKEHFISRLGKAAADAVMSETAVTVHRKLVIK